VEHRNSIDYEIPTGQELAGVGVNINGLFYEAQKALRKSYIADNKYYPYFGFPNLIDVDWDKDIIGDECLFKITNFKVSYGSEI